VTRRAHHETFHPIWGQLLKTGYQNSRYGHQIDRFACLYSSHVSNMAFYSPDTAYSGKGDSMAHEVSVHVHVGCMVWCVRARACVFMGKLSKARACHHVVYAQVEMLLAASSRAICLFDNATCPCDSP
jgi:hypothetical protein